VELEVFSDADAVALAAAQIIAAEARASIASRGRFALAVSGGHTPWVMLRALADKDLPWAEMQIFQVDERVAGGAA
jgi:6-phosphogluconolactonase